MGDTVGAAVEMPPLDRLEQRLVDLEKLLRVTPGYEPGGPITDRLVELATTLNKEIIKKLPADTQKVLSDEQQAKIHHLMSYEAEKDMAMSKAAKAELVLASEHSISRLARNLKEVAELEQYVNPKPLEDAAKFAPQLLPIAAATTALKEDHTEQSAQLFALLEQYNSIMTTLSQKFVYWDDILTAAEGGK